MRAAVFRTYGGPDVVHIEGVPRPSPKPGEVLVKVHATTVASGDARVRGLRVPRGFRTIMRLVFGWNAPRKQVLGTELSGVVEELGEGVTAFAVGDRVVAFPGSALGCHAEYRAVPVAGCLARLPPALSFEQGAALAFGGTVALHFLRDAAHLRPGEKVLVIGATGTVGSAAVQIAKHLGAEVTAVTSTPNVETARDLGADHVIDYTSQSPLSGAPRYDVVFDTVGNVAYAECRAALSRRGRLVLCAGSLPQIVGSLFRAVGSSHRVLAGSAAERPEHLKELALLAEQGAYTPLVDQRFPFEDIARAHARVDTGHKRGSVVVTLG